jgi:3-hydroxybutyryl-CoA dehydratase
MNQIESRELKSVNEPGTYGNLLETDLFNQLSEFYQKHCGPVPKFEKENIDKIQVGTKLSYSKKICELDVLMFGLLSGDFNPIHFDRNVAKKTKFGEPVVHGLLTGSLVSALLSRLPGIPVLLSCSLNFKSPVKPGDIVTVDGEVIEVDKEKKNRYTIKITCRVNEKIVVDGQAKILLWNI